MFSISNVHRLVVQCRGDDACSDFYIYCLDEHSICDVRCLDEETCAPTYAHVINGNQLITNFSTYTQNVIYQCDLYNTENNTINCVGIYGNSTAITCPEGDSHCEMTGVGYRILDGSSAQSLDLDCGTEKQCRYSTIICPSGSNASCTIDCSEVRSCYFVSVIVESDSAHYDRFQMNCTGNGGSCYNLRTSIDVLEIDHISFVCGNTGCQYASISIEAEKVSQITALCSSSGCLSSTWTVTVDELVSADILCLEENSCKDGTFGFGDATNLTVLCSAEV